MIDIISTFIQYSGWLGLLSGLFVAPAQLLKIMRTKSVSGISIMTYAFLDIAIALYFIHALDIGDLPFIAANGINLSVNTVVLGLLIKYR